MCKVIQHCMHVYSVIGNFYKTEEKTLLAMGAKNEEKISQINYFFAVAFFSSGLLLVNGFHLHRYTRTR